MASGHADYAPDITFPLTIQQGGTGLSTLTASGVLLGNGTSPVGAATGVNGQVLQVNAAGVPTFQSFNPLAVTYPFTLSPPAASVGEIIQLAASPTADAFQVKNSSGGLVFRVEALGECHAISQGPTNVPFVAMLASGQTADAVQVQDALNNPLFEITAGGALIVEPSDPQWIGLVVKGAALPTHDLAQFKDNASNILIEFGKTGQVTLAPVDTATIPLVLKVPAGATTSAFVIDNSALAELFGVSANGAVLVNPVSTTTIPLTLKLPALATAQFLELQDSSANLLAYFTNDGGFVSNPISTTAIPFVAKLAVGATGNALAIEDSLSNILASFHPDGGLSITPQSASAVPLLLKLAASPTGNALNVEDSLANVLTSIHNDGGIAITPQSASAVPLLLKLAASPTGNALNVEDSLANVLTSINSAGNITWPGTLTSSGAVVINAGGTNQNITLTPSGTGIVNLGAVRTPGAGMNVFASQGASARVGIGLSDANTGGLWILTGNSKDPVIGWDAGSLDFKLAVAYGTGPDSSGTLVLRLANNGTVQMGSAAQLQVNSVGSVVVLASNATVGDGVPAVLAQVARTGQTAAIAATNLITPPAAGLYRVSVYAVWTTAGTAGTLQVDIGWTDEVKAQDSTVISGLSDLVAGNLAQATLVVHAVPPGTIAYSTTLTGITGTPAYALYVTVEKIG